MSLRTAGSSILRVPKAHEHAGVEKADNFCINRSISAQLLMPLIICETHGAQGAALMCGHLQQQVSQGMPTRDLTIVSANFEDDPVWRVYLCPKCAIEHGYREHEVELNGDDGLDRIFEIANQRPACAKCFEECQRNGNELG
jgi:hypothetical protein